MSSLRASAVSCAVFILTIVFCLMLSAASPSPVAGPQGEIAWLDCSLGRVPGRESVRMLIMTIDDRIERVVVEPYGIAGIDHSKLTATKDRVAGTLVIGHEPRRMNRTLAPKLSSRMPIEVKLTIADGKISGTFDGQWPHEKSIDRRVDITGKVTGVWLSDADMTRRNAISKNATWPSWLGPQQNFSTAPGQSPIVDDLNDARLVWASQWVGPTESGSQRYGACVGSPPAAGGASPLYSDGRIYQFRYQAAEGEVQQTHLDKVLTGEKGQQTREKMKAIGWTENDLRRRWAIRADEQLVCLDASTGKALWTITWRGEGINLYDHKCSLTNHTGVIAHGNVYVFGALGVVRCVDASSGEVKWSAKVPGYHDTMQTFLAKCLETRNVHAPTRSFCHALATAGDVILAPDGIGSCGIAALDAHTGEVRWHVKDRVLGKCATPMRWNDEASGKGYVVAGNERGQITLMNERDGAITWQFDKAGDNEYQMLLVGDLLIGHRLTKEQRESAPVPNDDGPHSADGANVGQVACWRVSAQGLTEVWQGPLEWGAPRFCPIGSICWPHKDDPVICFRGGFSYHLVEVNTGKKLSSHHLTAAVRWDEGHMLAASDQFILHPDSQHGVTKMFTLSPEKGGKVSPLWLPRHPHATTYQSAMSHAWADGRLFIRGADALYCYDLRRDN